MKNLMGDGKQKIIDELARQQQRLQAFVELSDDIFFDYYFEDDRIEFLRKENSVTEYVQEIHNYSQVIGEKHGISNLMKDGHIQKLIREPEAEFELRVCGSDMQYHWLSILTKAIYDEAGNPISVVGRAQYIDEQKKREEKLARKSREDAMTGLYNQAVVKEIIHDRIRLNMTVAESYLVICDVDNFKNINDEHGHMFGDAVLVFFAEELKRLFPEEVIGRIGGDEFLLLVENHTREEMDDKLQELNKSLNSRYKDADGKIQISASIGVAAFDKDVKDYQTLFKWADYSLYQVKNMGKANYYISRVFSYSDLPDSSYLSNKKDSDERHRSNEPLVRNEEALCLFCVELLENVKDVSSALKMICDGICNFYDLDDVFCVEHYGEHKNITYQWNSKGKHDIMDKLHRTGVYEWNVLCDVTDEEGVKIFEDIQMTGVDTGEARSVMIVLTKAWSNCRYSIVFASNQKRDFAKERAALFRISQLIFTRLRHYHIEQMEKNLQEYRMNFDATTGLPAYSHFVKLAEEYFATYGFKDAYFTYMDFSNFQYINEMYGYEAGDDILKSFAEWLKKELPGVIDFSRVTSDHFVGICLGGEGKEMVDIIYDVTNQFCEETNAKYGLANLVISTGLYKITGQESGLSIIMDFANEARKHAKVQKAFSQVALYDRNIHEQNEQKKAVLASMVSALNNEEFYAYLQPKISIATGKIVGAEALVRWIRKDGTIIPPLHFVDIFEGNGFITKVDFCVLDRVLVYLKEALQTGEEIVPISVNFSRRHNEYEEFVPSIFRHLNRHGVPGELLEVEITESVFMSNLEKLNQNIEKLHEGGVVVSIDDFGSGYSSLNVLSSVTADVIKLDKEFLHYIDKQQSYDFVKHLIGLMKHMGASVLAEGVETQVQLDMLRDAGCDMAQGYYFAKPMPIEEFRKFLKEFNGK
ncbi:MAG: EAL domain-containing protein [Lachnospiraceae bacterium]|nr:EAL domain-containing protein [Lachnospiraceae bacterium]